MKLITRSMLLVLMGLIASFQGNAQTIINGGNVSGKWTKANSPYQVNEDITVAAGESLEIEPGVTVAFGYYRGLTINGQLLAQGTMSDSIIFTRQHYDYEDYWLGLTFNAAEGGSESVVRYAAIRYGTNSRSEGGGVCIMNGKVVLTNNTISNNTTFSNSYSPSPYGGGIYIADGNVTLTDNTISNNTANANHGNYSCGGGIYIANGNVTLTDNTISNNTANGNGNYNDGYSYGGGIYIADGNITLTDNTISNNTANANRGNYYYSNAYSCGGGIYIADGNVTLTDNTISNNNANADGYYSYNYGRGIYIANGNIILNDNTISHNATSIRNIYIVNGIITFNGNEMVNTGITSSTDGQISGKLSNNTLNYINLTNANKIEISNNTIAGNSSRGITISNSIADIIGNTISNNNGGISVTNNSVVKINGNTIKNNNSDDSHGSGIYLEKSTADVYNNTISGNSITSAGGGIYVKDMIANIYNNIISNNKHAASKTGDGGGICLYNSNSIIVNNTIVYNDAENGGGVYCSYGSSPVLINNILYGNTSSRNSQLFIADNNSAPKMLYNLNQCDCWGHFNGVNYNWEANYDESNFDANPRFMNYALQNYRLASNSPCINAGIEDVWGLDLPDVDMDGNMRIYGGRIDIGAYEYGAPGVNGIEDVPAQQPMVIFPNPSRDGVFHLKTDCSNFNWTVFDMTGKAILQGDTPQINLSGYGKGIYLVKVLTEKGGYQGKLVRL